VFEPTPEHVSEKRLWIQQQHRSMNMKQIVGKEDHKKSKGREDPEEEDRVEMSSSIKTHCSP
jgi:hypothetical protein